ncbi:MULTISPECIES: hypothetical protein [Sphingobium]|jgi:hypothetical protein|nr:MULTISPECIES: hypothetical protein [Sphingobium]NML12504.1 hypothetical protein [Sphingobium psychrophilum]|tara:strand:- start:31518 stop:31853 length:336 start_codon:yes stop_codon:yes gene_type:complete
MTASTIIADIPTGLIVVTGLVMLILAVRFRGPMSIAFAILCLFGTWNAGEAQPVLAAIMGIVLYGGLAIIGSIFGGRGELDHEARSGDYDYAAEQARLASEYHRRDRESRF